VQTTAFEIMLNMVKYSFFEHCFLTFHRGSEWASRSNSSSYPRSKINWKHWSGTDLPFAQ